MRHAALAAPLALLLCGLAAPAAPPTPLLTLQPGVMPRGLPAIAERAALSPSGTRIGFLLREGDGFVVGIATPAGERVRAVAMPNAEPTWIAFASEEEVIFGYRIKRPTDAQVEGHGWGSDKAVAQIDFVALLNVSGGDPVVINQPDRSDKAARRARRGGVADIDRLGFLDPRTGAFGAASSEVFVSRNGKGEISRAPFSFVYNSLGDQQHVLGPDGAPTLRFWGSVSVRLHCLIGEDREVARFGRSGETHPYWPVGPGPRPGTATVIRANDGRYDEVAVIACPGGEVGETLLRTNGDVQGILRDAATGEVIGAWTGTEAPSFAFTDDANAKVMRRIARVLPGETVWPVSIAGDGPILVFAEGSDRFFVFDRAASTLTPVLTASELGE